MIRAPTSDLPPQTGRPQTARQEEKAMSHTVPSQHPAVVLRSSYQHVRALLAVALIAIVGLTIAVVIVATSNTATISQAAHGPASATSAAASAEIGAKLDHRGVNTRAAQREDQLNRTYSYPGHY
jgi:hypothetical protein